MSYIVNLSVDRGANYKAEVYLSHGNAAAFTLDNYVIKSSIKKSFTANSATDFTTTVTDASNGAFTLELTSNQTAYLDSGRYYYDVIAVSNTYSVVRIIEGVVTIEERVSEP